jgi:hypothetical protein
LPEDETPEEELEEFLARLESEERAPDDPEMFKDWLKAQIGDYSDRQHDTLWDMVHKELKELEMGIVPVMVTYPWGEELRFGVAGLSGLWSWESVQQILSEESEE